MARTVTNLALGRYRRSRHDPVPTEAVAAGEGDRVGERVDLVRALRGLPAWQRDAVVLRYLADLDEATAAARMGCSVGAVKQHAHRGLAALRAGLRVDLVEGA